MSLAKLYRPRERRLPKPVFRKPNAPEQIVSTVKWAEAGKFELWDDPLARRFRARQPDQWNLVIFAMETGTRLRVHCIARLVTGIEKDE